MENSLFTHDELLIPAPADQVWDALVNPAKTVQYMHACEPITTWQVGEPIRWKGVEDQVVYVTGTLVALDKNQKFSFTVLDPQAEYEDIPENYLVATYTLEEVEEGTRLSVTQGDYHQVANGQARYEETMSYGGWSSVLEGIKKVVMATQDEAN